MNFCKHALAALAFLFSVSIAVAQGNDTTPLAPVRYASGHLTILERQLKVDPVTKMAELSVRKVCEKTVAVPVYVFGEGSTDSNRSIVTCDSLPGVMKVVVQTEAQLAFRKISLVDGSPKEEFKMASTFTWLKAVGTNDNAGPWPPSQNVLTRNLTEKNFIAVSRPDQHQLCIGNPNDPANASCEIMNPIVYEVVWDIQDNGQ